MAYTEEALALCRSESKNNNNPRLYIALGQLFLRQKRLKKAIYCAEQAIQLCQKIKLQDPYLSKVLCFRGKCYKQHYKDSNNMLYLFTAFQNYHAALKLDQTNIQAHYNLGVLNMRLGLFKRASKYFKYILSRDSTDYKALISMGDLSIRIGQYILAQICYEKSFQVLQKDQFKNKYAAEWVFMKSIYLCLIQHDLRNRKTWIYLNEAKKLMENAKSYGLSNPRLVKLERGIKKRLNELQAIYDAPVQNVIHQQSSYQDIPLSTQRSHSTSSITPLPGQKKLVRCTSELFTCKNKL